MTCREATEFLSDYVVGELAAEPLALFEQHLSRCPNCRAFLDQFRTTIRAGATSYEVSDADARTVMPEDMVKGIIEALRRG